MRIYKDQELKNLFNKLIISIKKENINQINKWGIQEHSMFEWLTYTQEELGSLAKAYSEYEYRDGNKKKVYDEAIQTATLCLKIAEMVAMSKPLTQASPSARSDNSSFIQDCSIKCAVNDNGRCKINATYCEPYKLSKHSPK